MKGRRGPYSKKEKDFINEHHNTLSCEEIAKRLGRDSKAVEKYIYNRYKDGDVEIVDSAIYDIQKSPMWPTIQKQFTPDELNMFVEHYSRTIAQFRKDVYHTEEIQIIDFCKLQILMERDLVTNRSVIEQVVSIETELRNLDKTDIERRHNLQAQLAALRTSQQSINDHYNKLQDQKSKILKELKATRDQRIKNLEMSDKKFSEWMKRVIYDTELRERLGIEMEKQRWAHQYEVKRLSELYEYSKTDIDMPILSDTTLKIQQDAEKEGEENSKDSKE